LSFTHSGNSCLLFSSVPLGESRDQSAFHLMSLRCPSLVRVVPATATWQLFPTVTKQDSIVHHYAPEVVTSTI
jgi:hypothetical protein